MPARSAIVSAEVPWSPRAPNSAIAASRISSRRTSALLRTAVFGTAPSKLALTYNACQEPSLRSRKMSTALVSGGSGFLGSHLCDHLLAHGHRVICVDNLDTGTLANIEHIRTHEFVFVNPDLTEPFFLEE